MRVFFMVGFLLSHLEFVCKFHLPHLFPLIFPHRVLFILLLSLFLFSLDRLHIAFLLSKVIHLHLLFGFVQVSHTLVAIGHSYSVNFATIHKAYCSNSHILVFNQVAD
mmetsp:Transcript_6983/g.6139  ORF Transcript_6983/g.6139 Transcript_6983/m.6139 type:complete len:108 (-) Transcript_6983:259-582(-)